MLTESSLFDAQATLSRENAVEDFNNLLDLVMQSVCAGLQHREIDDCEMQLFKAILDATAVYTKLIAGCGKPC